jgi:hypothetical protein
LCWFNVNVVLFQVEPYLTTLALFDAKQGRKLTENFHFDVNHPQVRNMVPCVSKNGSDDKCRTLLLSELPQVPEEWLMYPKQVIITTHIQQDVMETVWGIIWLSEVDMRKQENNYI